MSDMNDEFWNDLEKDLQASRDGEGLPVPETSEPVPFIWTHDNSDELKEDSTILPTEEALTEEPFPAADHTMPVFLEEEDENGSDMGPSDFRVDFDFDGEYRDAANPMPLSVRKEKRTGLVGGLMYGIFVICLGLIMGCLLWLGARDVLALGNADSEITITLPADAFYEGSYEKEDEDGKVKVIEANLCDLDRLADIMYDNGLVRYKELFKLYCKFSHADRKVGAGSYTLNTKYDYRALVYGAMPSSGMRVEVSVTIPEGYSLKRIFKLLEEKEVCSAEELWETAANYDFEADYSFLEGIPAKGDQYRLEGFLFPDTYYFYTNDNPERVITKFLSNFKVKFGDLYVNRAAELGYSIQDVVTIASMIEREASSYEGERDKIASVIYNRIRSSDFPYLNIDATILYGMSRNDDEDQELSIYYDTPYNTYQYQGLPPGPICNPGEDSIRAALYPESTNYYYYALHKGDGTTNWHEFFTSSSAFDAFVHSDNYGG